jgi:hypothetical protein
MAATVAAAFKLLDAKTQTRDANGSARRKAAA